MTAIAAPTEVSTRKDRVAQLEGKRAVAIREAKEALRLVRELQATLLRTAEVAPEPLGPSERVTGAIEYHWMIHDFIQGGGDTGLVNLEEHLTLWLGALEYTILDADPEE